MMGAPPVGDDMEMMGSDPTDGDGVLPIFGDSDDDGDMEIY
jgi:hypothetical protein